METDRRNNRPEVASNRPPNESDSDAVALVVTTLPEPSVADRLVRQLLDEQQIACGNIIPGVTSLYRWEGDIAREQEVLVLMKTRKSAVGRLFERITELHPYDVPELVEVEAEKVSAAYGQWVLDSTRIGA